MNSCEKIQEMISSMLDGELSTSDETLVREHIAQCEDCAAMYEDFASLSNELREGLAEVPASLHSRIMKGVRSSKKLKKPLHIAMRPYMGVAACLILVVGVVLAAQAGKLGADLAVGSTSKLMDMPAAPAEPAAPAAPADFHAYSFMENAETEEDYGEIFSPEAPAMPEAPAEPEAPAAPAEPSEPMEMPAAPEFPAEPEMPAPPSGTVGGDNNVSVGVTTTDDRDIILSEYDAYIPGTAISDAWMVVWFDDSGLVEYRKITEPTPLEKLLEDTPSSADPSAITGKASSLLKVYVDGVFTPIKLYFIGEYVIAETGNSYYVPAGAPEDFLALGSAPTGKYNNG